MTTKQEMNKKFFTEKGIEALRNRFGTLIEIYNKEEYPVSFNVLGFGILDIKSREELLGRIAELAQLIGESYMPQSQITKNNDGSEDRRYEITWLSE